MPLHDWLVLGLIFHPVPLTIIVVGAVTWLFVRRRLWAKYKRFILIGLAILYAVDTAFALPRIAYSWRMPAAPVVVRKIPLPAQLVLVGSHCDKRCHEQLFSGALDEVILVEPTMSGMYHPEGPVSYRTGWTTPGGCPHERARMIPWDLWREERQGFCPVIRPAEIPTAGIFIVRQHFLRVSRERATPFTSPYLLSSPPGRTIEFTGVEVQRRQAGRIELLASRRKYIAPGLAGLPPLIGCWERPDNIIWVLPPGDTGCGLWRWFTWGGDLQWQGDIAWVFADALTPAVDRPIELRAPDPIDR
jgi:hypothetical protein